MFECSDAEGADQAVTFDLDSVHQTEALDVSAAKNRISIKPKNKRVTVAMQQKMLRAEATTPKPAKSYHLQSLTEADEDEDEGRKETKTDPPPSPSAAAAAAGAEAPPATPGSLISILRRLLFIS